MNLNAFGRGNIFWLASYPKSGSTWVRAFISNLQSRCDSPIDINQLNTGEIASSREWIQSALDFSIDELSHEEIDRLRPQIYTWFSKKMTSPQYHKIHDAYIALSNGCPLIPKLASRGALVIVRNPLDVVVSFSHHFGCSIEKAISDMGDSTFAFSGRIDKQYSQVRQILLSWSEHVESWMDAEDFPRLIVRYEDLLENGMAEFTKISEFLELSTSPSEIKKALDFCDFKQLKKQEESAGFREKNCVASPFFRKGVVGDWRGVLSAKQVDTLITDHEQVMTRLGYLDSLGRVIDNNDYRGSTIADQRV